MPEILGRVNAYLWSKGLMLKRGSIVDATIIANVEMVKELLRGKEEVVHTDSGYTGRRAGAILARSCKHRVRGG